MNTTDRKRAEKVLEAVKERYAEYLSGVTGEENGPKILDYDDTTVVSWEEGPYEWAIRFTGGGFNEELYGLAVAAGVPTQEAERMATEEGADKLSGIYVEPYYSFSLAVYPE